MSHQMKTPRILWSLAASALLLSACAETPTSPSRQSTGAGVVRMLTLGSYDSTSFYVDGQLGQAWVKNTTPNAAVFMFALFDATNPNNQVDLESRNVAILQPGDSARLTVGLKVPRCKVIIVQPDVWINPPKVGPSNKYTLGELSLYGGGSTLEVSGEMDGCGILPTPPLKPPACSGGNTFTFPPGSYMAIAAPWYPTSIGPFAFSIPAGSWKFSSITGDDHSGKVGEYPPGQDPQQHEQAKYEFYAGAELLATSIATTDVPTYEDSILSHLGILTFSKPVTSIRAVHAGPPSSFPNDSFYPVSLMAACVEGGQ